MKSVCYAGAKSSNSNSIQIKIAASTHTLRRQIFLKDVMIIGVGEEVAGRAAAPLVEQKFATFGQFS